MSTASSVSCGGGEQATSAVAAPTTRACSSARRTYGVVPEAAMPMTKSPARTPCALRSSTALSIRSSAPSCERVSAGVPAGDDPLHHLGVGAVGRRTLGGVEHAESSGRARADVEQSTAAAKGRFGGLDGAGDGLALGADDRRERSDLRRL